MRNLFFLFLFILYLHLCVVFSVQYVWRYNIDLWTFQTLFLECETKLIMKLQQWWRHSLWVYGMVSILFNLVPRSLVNEGWIWSRKKVHFFYNFLYSNCQDSKVKKWHECCHLHPYCHYHPYKNWNLKGNK